MQKFVQRCLVRIFRTNAPDPHHWTLNSCFVLFLSVWGHLEPFRYCIKLAAKRAKLVQIMQKFVPRCLVRIFCNERSRSTTFDPKLMFGCVSLRSGAFWNSFSTARNLVQNTPNWCNYFKSSCNDVLLEFFATNAPDPHHWTLNSFLVRFFPFGCIWNCFAIAQNLLQNAPNWCN